MCGVTDLDRIIPLDVRCLINGLFCASEAIVTPVYVFLTILRRA